MLKKIDTLRICDIFYLSFFTSLIWLKARLVWKKTCSFWLEAYDYMQGGYYYRM